MKLHKLKILVDPYEGKDISTTECNGPSRMKLAINDEEITCKKCLKKINANNSSGPIRPAGAGTPSQSG